MKERGDTCIVKAKTATKHIWFCDTVDESSVSVGFFFPNIPVVSPESQNGTQFPCMETLTTVLTWRSGAMFFKKAARRKGNVGLACRQTRPGHSGDTVAVFHLFLQVMRRFFLAWRSFHRYL